ncbi:hypothetical protein D9M71_842050 [compost metagenome]
MDEAGGVVLEVEGEQQVEVQVDRRFDVAGLPQAPFRMRRVAQRGFFFDVDQRDVGAEGAGLLDQLTCRVGDDFRIGDPEVAAHFLANELDSVSDHGHP